MSIEVIVRPTAIPAALDEVATAASLGAAGSEAAVLALIQSSTALFEELAARELWYRGYREQIDATADRRLYLTARPLVSIESIKDGVNGEEVLEGTEADDYQLWLESGYLFRQNGWITSGIECLFNQSLFGHHTAADPVEWLAEYHGGWYLKSMDDPLPTGALRLEEDRPDISRAIFDMTEMLWRRDNRKQKDDAIKRDKLETKEREYHRAPDGGLIPIPVSAKLLACSLRPTVL
jgi:hypothetical protein